MIYMSYGDFHFYHGYNPSNTNTSVGSHGQGMSEGQHVADMLPINDDLKAVALWRPGKTNHDMEDDEKARKDPEQRNRHLRIWEGYNPVNGLK